MLCAQHVECAIYGMGVNSRVVEVVSVTNFQRKIGLSLLVYLEIYIVTLLLRQKTIWYEPTFVGVCPTEAKNIIPLNFLSFSGILRSSLQGRY